MYKKKGKVPFKKNYDDIQTHHNNDKKPVYGDYGLNDKIISNYDLSDFTDAISAISNLKNEAIFIESIISDISTYDNVRSGFCYNSKSNNFKASLFLECSYKLMYAKEELERFKVYRIKQFAVYTDHAVLRYFSFYRIYNKLKFMLINYDKNMGISSNDITDEFDLYLVHIITNLSAIFLNRAADDNILKKIATDYSNLTRIEILKNRIESIDYILNMMEDEAIRRSVYKPKSDNKKSNFLYAEDIM